MDRPKSFQWKGEPQSRTRFTPPSSEKGSIRMHLPRFRLRHIVFGFMLFVMATTAAIGGWIWSLNIDKLAIPVASPTQLLDIHGKAASEISSLKNEPVPIEQVPVSMRQAIIAVEDKRFYEHTGIDLPGIIRAAFRNARASAAVQGGSTITQQLAKNVFLSDAKTFARKLTEAGYAIKIEASYDKDRILEMYLNQIYFGEGQWGIQRGAKRYFGKPSKELTLAESALLAALPKAPSRYSPFRNKDLAVERRNLVLDLMRKERFISETEYIQAISEPIRLAAKPSQNDSIQGKYGSFADSVIDEAIQKYGFTERELMAGDLRIYTTLDPIVQNAMDTTFQNGALFPTSAPDQLLQSAAVILNPYTGGIRGIVGERGDHVFRGFNRATQMQRQPGSTFKPLMVYAPALEKGYKPDSMLYDGPLDIGGYRPQNADHQTRGQVPLHDALVHSLNIPSVWLLNEIGIPAGQAFVSKVGISMQKEDAQLGLALGGMSKGVSPLQMAQAFGVFPALGKLTPAHTILKITTAEGQVLALADQQQPAAAVMSKQNAFTMTTLLEDVVREGTGTRASLNRPTAGKTGTTQLPDVKEFEGLTGGAKDAWFVGYTPELVGAVWMGYDTTDRKHYLSTSGGEYPAMIFRQMMSLALKNVPASDFKQPNGENNGTGEKQTKQRQGQDQNQGHAATHRQHENHHKEKKHKKHEE